jgi:tetratricopeptide (TPR) repeat protein
VTGQLCREPGGQELIELLRQHAPTWLMQFPSFLNAADVEMLRRKTRGATRERMLREMAEAMEVAALTRPFILVLEDLHWSDTATLDFLAFLARRRAPARLLVVGTYRPAELAAGAHPLATLTQDLLQHRLSTEIAVPLLTQAEVAAYLEVRLPLDLRDDLSVEAWACRLHQRTDGNPLFLTNVVDYLLSQGKRNGTEPRHPSSEHLLEVVPHNLQQMIEKQIDRLSLEDQQLLEVASVVGVEFSAAAVAAGLESDVVAVEERCRELARRARFLRTLGVEEWPDKTVATQYGFIHSLYQQVLYQRVTEAQKVRLHLRVGTRLEAGCREQTRENATALARHFALGRNYLRAVHYSQQAAENAVWRCAFHEAQAHFTRGIELLHYWPDTPERTQQEILLHVTVLGPFIAVKGEASAEVEHVYERIIELHQQLGDGKFPSIVLLGLWLVRLVRGELVTAQEIAELIVRKAEREGDAATRLWGRLTAGICAFYRGDFTAAHACCVETAVLYDRQQHPQYLLDPKMLALSFEALSLWVLGQPALALQKSRAAVTWAQGLSHPYTSVSALLLAAWLRVNLRDGEAAEERVDTLLPVAQTHGFVQYVAFGMLLRAGALIEQRQNDEGARLIFQGRAAIHAVKVQLGMPHWQGFLATALRGLGRTEEALEVIAEAEAAMQNNGERFFAAEIYRIKGEILLTQEVKRQKSKGKNRKAKIDSQTVNLGLRTLGIANLRPLTPDPQGEAEACFLKAIDIARQQQAKSLELRAVMSLVRLRQQQTMSHAACYAQHAACNTLAEAHRMLSELCDQFTDECETADWREARVLLAELQGR